MTIKRLRIIELVVFFAAASSVAAQTPPPPLSVKPLRGGVYWTQGGVGGNTGIIIGRNGVIIIDAKTTPDSAKEMLSAVAKLTDKPVTHVILTHSDADHVNGLAAFPKGLTIIAHENNKKEQEAALAAGGPAAPPRDYLPNQVVAKDKESLKIDGVRIVLLHFAPAHTSGDLIVFLPDQKIVFAGDITATNHPFPFIHLDKNGSSEGWIKSAKGIAALDADTFVPGHGDLQTKADVQKRLADTAERRAQIKELVAQGKSLDEIRKTLGDTENPPPGGAYRPFTEVVYKELSKN